MSENFFSGYNVDPSELHGAGMNESEGLLLSLQFGHSERYKDAARDLLEFLNGGPVLQPETYDSRQLTQEQGEQ